MGSYRINRIEGEETLKKYDNMYCKPPQAGIGENSRYSVGVFFHVPENALLMLAGFKCGVYNGQYNFKTCSWIILPGDAREGIEDRYVDSWWHQEGYEDLCKEHFDGKYGQGSLRNEPMKGP